MADSDYDRDDDRPRRRGDDYGDKPKKKGSPVLMILLILAGVGLVLCVVPCVGIMIWGNSITDGAKKAAEGVLTKAGGGDMTGAYNGMSASYKATHTQEQFNKSMAESKLNEFVKADWTDYQSTNDVMTLKGTATLKSGGTTTVSVKVRLLPDLKTYEVEDVGR